MPTGTPTSRHEVAATEVGNVKLGTRVFLSGDFSRNAKRASMRKGTVLGIWRPRPRGPWRFVILWDGGPHPFAPTTLYRGDITPVKELAKRSR